MREDRAIAARGLLVLIGLLLILIWLTLTGCASIPPTVGCFGYLDQFQHTLQCGVRLLR
jgi:hypothetical protein